MNCLSAVGLMTALLLGFQLGSYGLTLWVLKHSAGLKGDFWWMAIVFAVPVGALEFIWLQAWRAGLRAEIKMWSMLVIVLACQVVGSAAALILYARQTPSWGNLLGLFLAVTGAAVAIASE